METIAAEEAGKTAKLEIVAVVGAEVVVELTAITDPLEIAPLAEVVADKPSEEATMLDTGDATRLALADWEAASIPTVASEEYPVVVVVGADEPTRAEVRLLLE